MTVRLAVIGFDATEPTIFARSMERALGASVESTPSARLVGLHDVLPDTVWPELTTGRSALSTGLYYQINQIRTGEPIARPRRADELDVDRYYWNVAARHGARVAVIDQPLSAPGDAVGVEVAEWGTHDRPGLTGGRRPLATGLGEGMRPYPVNSCDRANTGRSGAGADLYAGLVDGVKRKADLILRLLADGDWDLLTAVFSEGHCAGHQFWPSVHGAERGLIEGVYDSLAAALATVMAAIGEGTTVIAYCSHGMSPADHGARLVPQILTRMGLSRPSNRARRRAVSMVPAALRARVGRALGTSGARTMGLASRWPIDGPGVLAIPLPSSRTGAIRLSIAGRDPGGILRKGSTEHTALIDDLRGELLSLVTSGEGRPVVRDVVITDDLADRDRHDDLPDLVVRFHADMGRIDDVESKSLGRFRVPITSPRSGEHGPPGAVWVRGPGIEPGTHLGDLRTIDLAPTILGLLGIPIPEKTDGRAVPEIAE